MSNFDDFLNNLNSANQNDGPEEKDDSNLFDLNFEGSDESQNVEPSEEPVAPIFPEEVGETTQVGADAPNEDLFSFAQEEETFQTEEVPAEDFSGFASQAEEPAQEFTPSEEAPADGFFNFASQAEEPTEAPAQEAPADGFFNFASQAEEPAEAPAQEAPADGFFNFAPQAEQAAEDLAPSEEASADEFVEETTEAAEEVAPEGAPAFNFAVAGAAAESAEAGSAAEIAPATENPAESAAAGAEAAKPVKRVVRRAKPKKKRSLVGELIKIVIGGLLAFPLAHYILWGSYLAFERPGEGGLFKIPTPFIQASYKYAKNFPSVPVAVWKYTMLGFDPARDLAPDPVTPEVKKEQVAKSEEEVEIVTGIDANEVLAPTNYAPIFDSAHLPEYDPATVEPEWDPANLEAFQDTMLKISFLKDGDELETQAKEKIAKFGSLKEAKKLNKTMKSLIKKENHGK